MTWQARRISLLALRHSNLIGRQVIEFVHQLVNLPVSDGDFALSL
jgi:hypothetical protein